MSRAKLSYDNWCDIQIWPKCPDKMQICATFGGSVDKFNSLLSFKTKGRHKKTLDVGQAWVKQSLSSVYELNKNITGIMYSVLYGLASI